MHQHAAHRVMAQSPALVAPAVDALGYPDLIGCLALIGELGRILDKQDRTVGRSKAAAGGTEVTAENFSFLNTIVGKKAVSCLRVRPILARIGNALAHAVADLTDHFAKSSSKPRIFEGAFIDFAIGPVFATIISTVCSGLRCARKIVFCRQGAPCSRKSGARQ